MEKAEDPVGLTANIPADEINEDEDKDGPGVAHVAMPGPYVLKPVSFFVKPEARDENEYPKLEYLTSFT